MNLTQMQNSISMKQRSLFDHFSLAANAVSPVWVVWAGTVGTGVFQPGFAAWTWGVIGAQLGIRPNPLLQQLIESSIDKVLIKNDTHP